MSIINVSIIVSVKAKRITPNDPQYIPTTIWEVSREDEQEMADGTWGWDRWISRTCPRNKGPRVLDPFMDGPIAQPAYKKRRCKKVKFQF